MERRYPLWNTVHSQTGKPRRTLSLTHHRRHTVISEPVNVHIRRRPFSPDFASLKRTLYGAGRIQRAGQLAWVHPFRATGDYEAVSIAG